MKIELVEKVKGSAKACRMKAKSMCNGRYVYLACTNEIAPPDTFAIIRFDMQSVTEAEMREHARSSLVIKSASVGRALAGWVKQSPNAAQRTRDRVAAIEYDSFKQRLAEAAKTNDSAAIKAILAELSA